MIKLDMSKLKIALICATGILLNLIGTAIVEHFNLSIFLDTIGTVFIAALSGYVPGIAVGFFTNLIGSVLNPEEIYFGSVSVSLAVFTAFLANRGYYEKFPKVLLTIPATIFISTFLGMSIEELKGSSFVIKFDQSSLIEIGKHFLKNFSAELPDKTFCIMLTFFALKLFSPETREHLQRLGKMQAPVSPEMRSAMNKSNNPITSLRTKMVFNLMSLTLFIAVLISAISYTIYQDNSMKDRIRIADGIITMAVNEIDPKRVDEFLEHGYQAEGYSEVEKKLYKIRNSNSDVKYLYVYKIMEDGCHVVFDLDTADVEATAPGEIEDFDDAFKDYLPDLLAGRPIPPLFSNETYGNLFTIYKPVYDSEGHCVCYAGLDFSTEDINNYGRMFIVKVITIFSGAVIFVFALAFWFIENNIILPVNTMAYCARNFSYDSKEAREENVGKMQRLEINTNDEIENLYTAFLKSTEDGMYSFDNFTRSKLQLAVMDALAHKDALTGLNNKTAYNEAAEILDAHIKEELDAAFAIVMIDVNFLKRVNDTYGHEYGNEYLINAAKLACEVFGEDHVYRVGGDEFVVLLDGENLNHCDELVANIRARINKFANDDTLQPWEKVSAAIGVAHYRQNIDSNAEEVFKRADQDMYKNKLAMKAMRKD